MTKNIKRKLGFIFLLYAGLATFLFITNPINISVGWLIAPFIGIFFAIYFSVKLAFDWLGYSRVGGKKRTTAAIILAALPTMMLLLDSVDQLTLRDSLIIIVFGLLAILYANKINIHR